MEKDIIRVLRPEEIEVWVSTVNDRGVSLLLYKDARVGQRILDETFGSFKDQDRRCRIRGRYGI